MRGIDERSGSLFSYVDIEARIPAKHPLRRIRDLALQLLFSRASDSMGNHDLKIVDAGSVD